MRGGGGKWIYVEYQEAQLSREEGGGIGIHITSPFCSISYLKGIEAFERSVQNVSAGHTGFPSLKADE